MRINCPKHGIVKIRYLGRYDVACQECYTEAVEKFVRQQAEAGDLRAYYPEDFDAHYRQQHLGSYRVGVEDET